VRIVCCLIGGLIATVIVAAACLFYSRSHMVEDHGGISSDDRSPGAVTFKHGQRYAGFGYREWMDCYATAFKTASGSSIIGAGVTSGWCGWPFLAFATPRHHFASHCANRTEWDKIVKTAYARSSTSDVVPPFFRVRPSRQIPTRPAGAGLVGDVLFYAVLIGGCWFGLSAARRAWRRRRGRCSACGYPMGGLARCPECGEEFAGAVASHVRAPFRASAVAPDAHRGLAPRATPCRRFAAGFALVRPSASSFSITVSPSHGLTVSISSPGLRP
jgi:hypothetical protein